jgi:hypothetical protein
MFCIRGRSHSLLCYMWFHCFSYGQTQQPNWITRCALRPNTLRCCDRSRDSDLARATGYRFAPKRTNLQKIHPTSAPQGRISPSRERLLQLNRSSARPMTVASDSTPATTNDERNSFGDHITGSLQDVKSTIRTAGEYDRKRMYDLSRTSICRVALQIHSLLTQLAHVRLVGIRSWA